MHLGAQCTDPKTSENVPKGLLPAPKLLPNQYFMHFCLERHLTEFTAEQGLFICPSGVWLADNAISLSAMFTLCETADRCRAKKETADAIPVLRVHLFTHTGREYNSCIKLLIQTS